MTVIRELRIPLPMTVEEFQRGQLYAVNEASKEATGGQTAIEILINEPFEDPVMGNGQYTHKIYHIAGRCPRLIQAIAPASALKIEERAWNAYPYCKTVFTNEFLGERFHLQLESMHLPDDGSTENALKCDEKTLAKRKVLYLDIHSPEDPATRNDPHLDTSKYVSTKAGRGPLVDGWQRTADPLMCCYKLITIKFQVFGIQGKVESAIDNIERDIMMRFFKQVFCLMDQWYDLSMEDIRRIEEETKAELAKTIAGMNLETKSGKPSEPSKSKIEEHIKPIATTESKIVSKVPNELDSERDRPPREL